MYIFEIMKTIPLILLLISTYLCKAQNEQAVALHLDKAGRNLALGTAMTLSGAAVTVLTIREDGKISPLTGIGIALSLVGVGIHVNGGTHLRLAAADIRKGAKVTLNTNVWQTTLCLKF